MSLQISDNILEKLFKDHCGRRDRKIVRSRDQGV